MKKAYLIALATFYSFSALKAQEKYFTKSGNVSFYSKATLENIEAHNKTVTCVLDTKTGNLQFAVMVKAFEFEKALMQEHFNENYLESHKFPKAEFKGQVINNGEVNYVAGGKFNVKVRGKLTLHGETREIETTGTIEMKSGRLETKATFNVALADFKVEIPNLVKDNISKTVQIAVSCSLDPFKG